MTTLGLRFTWCVTFEDDLGQLWAIYFNRAAITYNQAQKTAYELWHNKRKRTRLVRFTRCTPTGEPL